MPEAVNVNLARGYGSAKSCLLIGELGVSAEIARKDVPAPVQARQALGGGAHAPVDERLRQAAARCTEKGGDVVDFYLYLYLAAAPAALRMLIRRSMNRYRWGGRPSARRLK